MAESALLVMAILTACAGLTQTAVVNKDSTLRFVPSRPLNSNDNFQYSDCHHLREVGGYNESGVYTLHLNKSYSYQISCEFTAETSYNIIQRRMNGIENFQRSFFDYVNGFGSATSDFWLGLNQIYFLTFTQNNVLTIHMQKWDGQGFSVQYKHFSLSGSPYYVLSIGGFAGSIPDDMFYNNGMPFSTYDKPDINNCAGNIGAGWWYNYCTYALPNGRYYAGSYIPSGAFYDGIYWKDLAGYGYSLKYFSMLLSRTT